MSVVLALLLVAMAIYGAVQASEVARLRRALGDRSQAYLVQRVELEIARKRLEDAARCAAGFKDGSDLWRRTCVGRVQRIDPERGGQLALQSAALDAEMELARIAGAPRSPA
jgi:hypothetical protein